MKKQIITMSEYRQISPYKCGQLLMALERNKVKAKAKKKKTQQNFSVDFSKNAITKHIVKSILNS
jgi:hypothetical protein